MRERVPMMMKRGVMGSCLSLSHEFLDKTPEAKGDSGDEAQQGKIGSHSGCLIDGDAQVETQVGGDHEDEGVGTDPDEAVRQSPGELLFVQWRCVWHGFSLPVSPSTAF